MQSPNKNIIVKNYQGNSESATRKFQKDSVKMAEQGYFPVSQSWTPGTYGFGCFIVAVLLVLFVIGVLVFIYMLVVKPEGTLTVTYELQASAPIKLLSYTGAAELTNDSYILYLTKRYDIERNQVLEKFSFNERLYSSISEALISADQIYKAELNVKHAEMELSAKRNERVAQKNESHWQLVIKIFGFFAILVAAIFFGSFALEYFNKSKDQTQDLIKIESDKYIAVAMKLNEDCRGGHSDATDEVCIARDIAFIKLNSVGYCYGKEMESGYQHKWHKCVSDSRRSDGKPPQIMPSFSCGVAKTNVELMICGDGFIAALDLVMATLVNMLKESGIETNQADWRNKTRNLCSTTECLYFAYAERINLLASRFEPTR